MGSPSVLLVICSQPGLTRWYVFTNHGFHETTTLICVMAKAGLPRIKGPPLPRSAKCRSVQWRSILRRFRPRFDEIQKGRRLAADLVYCWLRETFSAQKLEAARKVAVTTAQRGGFNLFSGFSLSDCSSLRAPIRRLPMTGRRSAGQEERRRDG